MKRNSDIKDIKKALRIERELKHRPGPEDITALIRLGIERIIRNKNIPDTMADDLIRQIRDHCNNHLQRRLTNAVTGHIRRGGGKACICGHSIEEHGHDPEHPDSTACTKCDCVAYEEDQYDKEDQT